MPADPDFAAFGPRPFQPLRQSRVEIAVKVCEATAEAELLDARMRGRSNPDEAESLKAHAERRARLLGIVAAMLRGEDLPESALTVEPVMGPADHRCEFPGCGNPAPFGFGLAGEAGKWACGAHQEEVGQLWQSERAARLEKAKAILEQPAETSMAGLGNRLI